MESRHPIRTTRRCDRCGRENRIVNECRCDPNNLPTAVPPESLAYMAWLAQDAGASMAQGWSIFLVTGRDPDVEQAIVNGKPYDHRPFELQAVLDAGVFADDSDAWAFVKGKAAAGDTLALRAAEFLRAYSPCEHEAVFGEESRP